MKKAKYFLPFCISFILFFSCKTTQNLISSSVTVESDSIEWKQLQNGIELSENNYFSIVKLYLDTPDLNLIYNKTSNKWQKAIDVKKFAKEQDLTIAINTVPFETKSVIQQTTVKPVGTIIEDSVQKNPSLSRYCGIQFYLNEKQKLRAKIYSNQLSIPVKNTVYAAGGFWQILNDEEIYQFKDIKDYRTAVATNKTEDVLYLLWGKNLSFMDCACILKEAGAYTAMEFDGGSSSCMYIKNKKYHKAFPSKKICAALGFR